MGAWLIWLIIAMGFGIAELLALTLDLGLLALAALAASLVAATGLGVVFQFVGFAVVAALMVLFVRPVARRHLQRGPLVRSGTAGLVGRDAWTLTEVSRRGGRVRIGGEEWTARPYDPALVIPADSMVDVFDIDGATALVHPQDIPQDISQEEPWQS